MRLIFICAQTDFKDVTMKFQNHGFKIFAEKLDFRVLFFLIYF